MRNGELLMVETPEMLRYKALNGHIIDVRAAEPMSPATIAALEDHPLIRGHEVKILDRLTVQFSVEDASTAIPNLLGWCNEHDIDVESINEFVPPFDDVFVTIMERYAREEAEATA